MSDQQLSYDSDGLRAPSTGRGGATLVSTANADLAERYRRLLECAGIPVHVPESCLDRACEVVARDHAEASDGPHEEDDILDDDDDECLDDDPVDDDDDDPFLDDGDDDHFDDDSDDHSHGEPDKL